MNKNYDLIIKYPDAIGTKLANEIERGGQLITPNLKVVKYTPQPMMSSFLDAVITFTLFASAGILNGFFQELGKNQARSLKKFFCTLITKVKRHNCRKVTEEDMDREYKLSKIADKLDKKELKSQLDAIGIPVPPLAIRIQITNYYNVDFIFPDDITQEQVKRALSTIRKKLALHLLFAETLPELEAKHGDNLLHILANSDFERVYIHSNGEWIVQTPQQITESEHKHRKSQRRITSKK